jgi:hypothetical protein
MAVEFTQVIHVTMGKCSKGNSKEMEWTVCYVLKTNVSFVSRVFQFIKMPVKGNNFYTNVFNIPNPRNQSISNITKAIVASMCISKHVEREVWGDFGRLSAKHKLGTSVYPYCYCYENN